MTRNEREQALWHDAYMLAMSQDPSPAESSCLADAAVAEFRKRYPSQPSAPEAVWYDEPPFPKDGTSYPCWIEGHKSPSFVYWAGRNWRAWSPGDRNPDHLNGRRVSPIIKPQEPTT